MSPALVKSARLERGRYREQPMGSVVIMPSTDVRTTGLERELEDLRAELATLRGSADTAAAEAFRKGYEEGFAAGVERGRAEALQVARDAALALNATLKELRNAWESVWEESRRGVVSLSLAIAKRVVGQAAQFSETMAEELARRCLAMVRDQARVIIAVNPDDAARIRAAEVQLMALGEGIRHLEVVERSSVKRGGVVVETEAGQWDARWEEQLRALENALLPTWSGPERGELTAIGGEGEAAENP